MTTSLGRRFMPLAVDHLFFDLSSVPLAIRHCDELTCGAGLLQHYVRLRVRLTTRPVDRQTTPIRSPVDPGIPNRCPIRRCPAPAALATTAAQIRSATYAL